MKNASRARAIATIVSVFALAGCSSTQPENIGTRLCTLSFSASAIVGLYNCYDIYQDTTSPPDGIPDTFLQSVCQPVLVQVGDDQIQDRGIRNVPWRYSIKVTVVRAGGVNEELVVSSDGTIVGSSVEPGDFVEDFESLTEYDKSMPDIPDQNTGDIYFINGKLVSAGSPLYLSSISVDLGVPNILSVSGPATFSFNIDTGDTVIVRARKQPFNQAPPYIPEAPDPEIRINAVLAVSGVVVTTQGNTISTAQDSSGMTFSFTVQ